MKPWHVAEREVTDERYFWSRREAIKKGAALIGALSLGAAKPGVYPPKRNAAYQVKERGITPEGLATSYNNFYEFSTDKAEVKDKVAAFQIDPWSVEVAGLCHKPKRFSLDEILGTFALEERVYRFRCVEAWSMTVPWCGFPLRKLLESVAPMASAKYVRFISFQNEAWAPGQAHDRWYPWPYFEGLEMKEAVHELTMVVTGAYGKELKKQSGAPIRIIVPWKYGYKSPKSIVRIELVEKQPPTFWNQIAPSEYGFHSNVDPTTPHPRWSQRSERLLDTGEKILSQAYNGYGELVAGLYKS